MQIHAPDALDDADHGARLHDKKEAAYTDEDGFVYSRWGSPTNEACARQIHALESGAGAGRRGGGTLLFGSGMSAITSALMSVLKEGDHAVFPYTGECLRGVVCPFARGCTRAGATASPPPALA